jgi:hypothetical protein
VRSHAASASATTALSRLGSRSWCQRLRIVAEIAGRVADRDQQPLQGLGRGRRCLIRAGATGDAGSRAAGVRRLPARQRLETLLLRWFDALSAHWRVSVQMLTAKLWLFHPHHWVPLIFNLSRAVLWLRDSAALDAGSPWRELEEVGLTWLFLLTLLVWAGD